MKNGRPITTKGSQEPSSLKVADVFEKDHKNVLQAIQELERPSEFRELNFQLSEYRVAGNNVLDVQRNLLSSILS